MGEKTYFFSDEFLDVFDHQFDSPGFLHPLEEVHELTRQHVVAREIVEMAVHPVA